MTQPHSSTQERCKPCLHGDLDMNAQRDFICDSARITNCMLTDRKMTELIVVHSCKGLLLSHKQTAYKYMDKP